MSSKGSATWRSPPCVTPADRASLHPPVCSQHFSPPNAQKVIASPPRGRYKVRPIGSIAQSVELRTFNP